MNAGLFGYPAPPRVPFKTSRVTSVPVIGDGQRMSYVPGIQSMLVCGANPSDSVWLIRTRDQSLHRKIAIGGNAAAGFYCPGNGLLYIASVTKALRAIRPSDGATIATIDLSAAIAGTSFYMCYASAPRLIVIADHANSAPRVVDIEAQALTGSIATASGKGLAYVPSMNRVVTSWASFFVMDPSARTVAASYVLSIGDGSIAYAPKVDRVFLCAGETTLKKVNPSTGAVDASLVLTEGTGNNPLCYCPENGLVYVAAGDPGVIYAINPLTMAIVATTAVDGHAHGLCYCPDNRAVWAVHATESRGWMVGVDNHRIIGEFALP